MELIVLNKNPFRMALNPSFFSPIAPGNAVDVRLLPGRPPLRLFVTFGVLFVLKYTSPPPPPPPYPKVPGLLPPFPPKTENVKGVDPKLFNESEIDPPAPPPPEPPIPVSFPPLPPFERIFPPLPAIASATIITIPPPFPPYEDVPVNEVVEAPPP